ncbi:hypothetical protein H9Q13_12420 [Pontibacter sp. JH31]|uniref:Lipoprotein n=1 Tax=Pontibacter aquaedesilientis TaxID=2766980 RepID=A0ABR7XI98_9BACT|nr:hypothetical protein [Pontibacter aquaedesilientis]MBD1397973.1 hypothetical protein [Pontibacter aquaedesilientis]
MKSIKKKAYLFAIALLGVGMAACSTGTDPGETNVERSDIEETEEMDRTGRYSDTTAEYEEIYEGREETAIGDSAYNQEGKRDKRYDKNLNQNPKKQ